MSAKKEDLIAAVQAKLGELGINSTKKEAETAIDVVCEAIHGVAKEHESVRTQIGTFKYTRKEARQALNPKTGEAVQVPAHSTLTFKANRAIKEVEGAKAAPAKKVVGKPAAKAVVTKKVVKK